MTLLVSLLDVDYDTFLIDEPELGISPEAQGILADFLFGRAHRQNYFPHIKSLILATHSTIFLDRLHISNNYHVDKIGDIINVRQLSTQSEFNQIHFFLLGNRFETLYLPSSIVIVEGKCDYKFIDRILTLRYPQSQISVVAANGDARVKEILHIAKGLFTDIQKSPYGDRIFVVLDAIHNKGLPTEIESIGIRRDNIIIWEKNGIEHYYPLTIVDTIYGARSALEIDGDFVSRNGIKYSKNVG